MNRLDSRQLAARINPVAFAKRPSSGRSFERVTKGAMPPIEKTLTFTVEDSGSGDTGESERAFVAADYAELRDHLALTKLRGYPLTAREESVLASLNLLVDREIPPRPPFPDSVRRAMEEAERFPDDGEG